MSTVPPSPAWPTTRMSSRPLALQGGRDAGGDGRPVAEQRVQPGQLPRRLGVRRGEHLEAAGGVHRDHLPAGGAHRRVEHVARPERLAAALAGAVARGQRVRPAHPRLHRPLLGLEQPVAGHERAGLVELDLLVGHGGLPTRRRRTRRCRGRAACARRAGPAASRAGTARARAGPGRGRGRGSAAAGSRPGRRGRRRGAAQRRAGDRPAAEPRHHVVHLDRQPAGRVPGVLADDPARAHGERLLQDDHPAGVLQRLAHLGDRPRPEAGDAQGADRRPFVPQGVHDLLDGAQHRPERDDDGVRVLGPVRLQQPAGVPAEVAAGSPRRSPGSRRGRPSAWRASGTSPR